MTAGFANTQSWIYSKVKQIDGEIDHHKNECNEAQIGRHDWHIGKRNRLNEQQAHAWPLKNSFCDDGKRNESAQLQACDGHDRHECVFKGMAKMNGPV